jgi:putative membrane protein
MQLPESARVLGIISWIRGIFYSEDYFFIGDGKMMGGFGLGFMGIFWVALIIVGFVLFRQYSKGKKGPEDTGSTPLDVLRQRYAKGEINKEEYEIKKRDLA